MLGSPLLIWGNKNLKNGHRLEEKPETEELREPVVCPDQLRMVW